MKKEDIIALARAGFTVEQIAAIAQQPDSPAPVEAPAAPAPAQAAPAPVQNAPAPAPVPGMDDVLKKLGVLTEAIQSSAILNSSQPKEESADDILATIIAPPTKNEQ